MLENRVSRKIFGLYRVKAQEGGENCKMKNFVLATLQQIMLEMSETCIRISIRKP
jgi:hypothetical protein